MNSWSTGSIFELYMSGIIANEGHWIALQKAYAGAWGSTRYDNDYYKINVFVGKQ